MVAHREAAIGCSVYQMPDEDDIAKTVAHELP